MVDPPVIRWQLLPYRAGTPKRMVRRGHSPRSADSWIGYIGHHMIASGPRSAISTALAPSDRGGTDAHSVTVYVGVTLDPLRGATVSAGVSRLSWRSLATSPARRASKRGETAHHHQQSGRQPGRERSRARRGHLSPDAAVAGRGARRKAANDLRLREGHSGAPRSTQSCRNGCERACAHVPQVEQCWQAATAIWSGGDGFP